MRVVYMGTPDFAVPSLEALILQSRHEVVGVVTSPDRPKGRGLKVVSPPIKQVALEYGLPLWQPERMRDSDFVEALRVLNPDLFLVVAFRILPDEILKIPTFGAVNLHPSLLPKYRGAAPIQWAVMNGEKETGVTTFLIERKMDAGHIICQDVVTIGHEETGGDLYERLSRIGAALVLRTVDLIENGDICPEPQKGVITMAPKISKEDGRIDWSHSASVIHNKIRGLNPFPMAFTTWREKILRVISSQPLLQEEESGLAPGSIIVADKQSGITVQTGGGGLKLVVVQPEGRKPIEAVDFLRGYRPSVGDRFGI